jgi:periodic tryptophan protein 2
VAKDTLQHNADVLAVAFRPDGKELASASLDGRITIWDPIEAQQLRTSLQCPLQSFIRIKIVYALGIIDGRKDLASGRVVGQAREATTATKVPFL